VSDKTSLTPVVTDGDISKAIIKFLLSCILISILLSVLMFLAFRGD